MGMAMTDVKNYRKAQRLCAAFFANSTTTEDYGICHVNISYTLYVTGCGRNLLFCIRVRK
jgi:hypothetical protein